MGKIMPNGIRFGLGENIGYIMIHPDEDAIKVTVTAYEGDTDRESEIDPELFQSIADEIRRCQREYGQIEIDEAELEPDCVPVPLEMMKVKTKKQ